MAFRVLLVVFTTISLGYGQVRQGDLVGPVLPYPVITAQMERELMLNQNPELLALAATRNQRILVEIEGPRSIVAVQEGVNANLDCFPWLSRFPGGTVEWFRIQRETNGDGNDNI
jgi:hypothetical protein